MILIRAFRKSLKKRGAQAQNIINHHCSVIKFASPGFNLMSSAKRVVQGTFSIILSRLKKKN
jgi:hypothetical protein